MADLVLGGIGHPVIYSLDKELNSNLYWDDSDISSIVRESNITATIISSSDSPYSDTILRVVSSSPNRSIYIPLYTYSGRATNASYFSMFIIQGINGQSLKAGLACLSGVSFTKYESLVYTRISQDNQSIFHFITNINNSYSTGLYMYIELPSASEFYFYLNSTRAIISNFVFDSEQSLNFSFKEIINSDVVLFSGRKVKSSKGWMPSITFSYEDLLAIEEVNRSIIFDSGVLGVVPRHDAYLAFLCQWNGNYKREYINDKMIGHRGDLSFESVFLFKEKPIEIVNL